MADERYEKRRAYEAAGAHYRACYEQYHPVRALGGRAAQPMTPDAEVELERLKTAWDAARITWEQSPRR
jgi:hypothetical protein